MENIHKISEQITIESFVMTIDQLLNNIEQLIQDFKPTDADDEAMFFDYDYDSDTHWIKLGIPPEWLEEEDED